MAKQAVADCRAIEPHPKEKREQAFRMFMSGMVYSDIAHEIKVACPTIRSWSQRGKWQQQRKLAAENPGMDAKTVAELAQRDPGLDIPPELSERQQEYTDAMGEVAVKVAKHIQGLSNEEVLQKADRVAKIDAVARRALKLETDKPFSVIQIGVLCQPVRPAQKDDGRLRSTRSAVELLESE